MFKNIHRRDAVKLAFLAAASFFLPPFRFLVASDKDVPPGETVIAETDPSPSANGYRKDATKVDTKIYPKRAGVAGKTQFCENCVFYAKVNVHWGNCSMFGAGVVTAKGWCNSWAKKPNA